MRPGSVALLRLAHGLRERRYDLEHVADDAVVRHFEDRRFLVPIDRDDRLGGAHSGEVLDGTRDPDRDIQLRTHLPPRLADLVGMWPPALVGDGTSRTDRAVAQGAGQIFNRLALRRRL